MSVREGTTALVSYAAGTATGSCRAINEDALGVFEAGQVFAVVDGCGGRGSGRTVAELVVSHLGHVAGARAPDGLGAPEGADPLAVAIMRANTEALRRSNDDLRERGAGAALCAVRVSPGWITIAHVGDSRAARVRGGELEWMTEDHSLVAHMRRAGTLAEADVADFPHKNVITRAIGTAESLPVDIQYVPARVGDLWMLCTDGLHVQVPTQRIVELLTDGSRTLADRCRALLDAAESAGGHDSATVVLLV